jgi:uncharacterized membrane protein
MNQKKLTKGKAFLVIFILIIITCLLILFATNCFNEQILYGILTGLGTGLIITILSWVTK